MQVLTLHILFCWILSFAYGVNQVAIDNNDAANSAFLEAVKNENIDRMRELITEQGVNPAANDNYALRYAAENGYVGVVKELLALPLDRGVNRDALNTALQKAAFNGHVRVVKELLALPLDRGVAPYALNNALRASARDGYVGVVKELLALPLNRGVNPASLNNYAFRLAALNGEVRVVKVLLALPPERGVNPAVDKNFALRLESRSGNEVVIRDLLLKDPRVKVIKALDDIVENQMLKSKTFFEIISTPVVFNNRPVMVQVLSHPKLQSFLAKVTGRTIETISEKVQKFGDKEPLEVLNLIMKETDTSERIGKLRSQFLFRYYAKTARESSENLKGFPWILQSMSQDLGKIRKESHSGIVGHPSMEVASPGVTARGVLEEAEGVVEGLGKVLPKI